MKQFELDADGVAAALNAGADPRTVFRTLIAEASCDPRTMALVFSGAKVHGIARHRAYQALVRAGLLPRKSKGNR